MPPILPKVLASEMGGAIGKFSPEKKWIRKNPENHGSMNRTSIRLSKSPADQGKPAAAGERSPALVSPEPEHQNHRKKKKKKKKKRSRIPKGFCTVRDGSSVYHNSANGWFYDATNLHYYKTDSGPFFVYDTAQKKLVPVQMKR